MQQKLVACFFGCSILYISETVCVRAGFYWKYGRVNEISLLNIYNKGFRRTAL